MSLTIDTSARFSTLSVSSIEGEYTVYIAPRTPAYVSQLECHDLKISRRFIAINPRFRASAPQRLIDALHYRGYLS